MEHGWYNVLRFGKHSSVAKAVNLIYLKSECEKVHDVVAGGGVLHVTAVHVHCVLELLGPGLVVNAHPVNIVTGHDHHLVHDVVELVVVGDRDSSAVDLADLGPGARVEKLQLKVLVLLEFHVVNDWNTNGPVSLEIIRNLLQNAKPFNCG